MKKSILILFFVNLFISFLVGCGEESSDDPCDGIDCGANGTCVDGTCECDVGQIWTIAIQILV